MYFGDGRGSFSGYALFLFIESLNVKGIVLHFIVRFCWESAVISGMEGCAFKYVWYCGISRVVILLMKSFLSY